MAVPTNRDCLLDCLLFDPYVPLLSMGDPTATDCPGSHTLKVLFIRCARSALEPRAAYSGTHSVRASYNCVYIPYRDCKNLLRVLYLNIS